MTTTKTRLNKMMDQHHLRKERLMRQPLFAPVTRLLALAVLLLSGNAWAEPVGQVMNLSGPLFALNAQGVQRILSIGSSIEPGETLVTEGKTYAQVRFIDKGVITLRPGTHFKVEAFAYDEKAPEKDNAIFGLLKGALRAATGLIGKRGNQDAYRMNAATATIGIRGTKFLAQLVSDEEKTALSALSLVPYALPPLASLDPGLLGFSDTMTDAPAGLFEMQDIQMVLQLAQSPSPGPGLYVHVFEGMVGVSNGLGSGSFGAGQTGFSPFPGLSGLPPSPPIIVPTPPGIINTFTPPPTFQNTEQLGQQAPSGQSAPPPPPGSQQQDQSGCEVR
jgi:hypothetical protein